MELNKINIKMVTKLITKLIILTIYINLHLVMRSPSLTDLVATTSSLNTFHTPMNFLFLHKPIYNQFSFYVFRVVPNPKFDLFADSYSFASVSYPASE